MPTISSMFDIVIPVGPSDISCISGQLVQTKKNIVGYRNIYLISYDTTLQIEGCTTIDERTFPFTIGDVASCHGSHSRNGWYLQQLLKLYAGFCIPDILERYLVIDSDTFFLKPTEFIGDEKCLYNYGSEYHLPYFHHMARLHPTLTKVSSTMSGICHHMMFETRFVKELFQLVEELHKDDFWVVFLEQVDKDQDTRSGASEYEIYFNFMLQYHPDDIIVRPLRWANVGKLDLGAAFDYVSYHHYMRS